MKKFLDQFANMFYIDDQLLFNEDEIILSSKVIFKAVTTNPDRQAVRGVDIADSHISVLFSFPSIGIYFPPFIILPNLKNLHQEIMEFE